MKQKLLSILFIITILSIDTFAQAEKWTNLFNGKTLNGFKQLSGKALYEAKNGEIVGTTVKDTPNSFLATEQDYGWRLRRRDDLHPHGNEVRGARRVAWYTDNRRRGERGNAQHVED